MKKITFYVISFLLFIILICSCSSNHEHMFSNEWSFDDTYHYHQATCEHKNEKQNVELHIYGDWKIIQDATADKDGLKARECKICKYQQTESIPKGHNHEYSKTWTYDATTHWHAAICEHKDEKSDVASHLYGDWIIIKNPSGNELGERKRTCEVCHYEQVEQYTEHQHTYSTEWSSDVSGHWHQANCEHTYERTELEDHTYGDWIIVKQPTTSELGVRKKICSICAYEKIETMDEIDHEHAYGAWEVLKSPTKTSKGSIVRVCEFNASHKEELELPVLSEEDYTYYLSAPTCFEAGYEKYTYKWMHGFSFTLEVPSTGHQFSSSWTSNETHHWHQAICEHSDEISMLAPHTYGDWVIIKQPTEEEEGTRIKICTDCKYEIYETMDKLEHTHKYSADWSKNETHHWHAAICIHKEEKLKYEEHQFGEWVKVQEATPSQSEILKRTCETCNYEEFVDNGHLHTYSKEYLKTETMHWKECACGDVIEYEEHTYGDWEHLKDPTNTEEGLKKKSCKVCNYEYFEVIDRLDHIHIYETAWTYDETHHWQSASCHPEEYRNKNAHSFGPWQIVEDSTETQEGTQKRSCVVCEYVDTEKIPLKPHTHSYSAWEVVDQPTKTEKGLIQRTCKVDQFVQTYELPVLSEEDYDYKKTDPTCQAKGEEIYSYVKGNQTLEFRLEIHMIAHKYSMEYNEHVHWETCGMCGKKTAEEAHNLIYNECQVCHFQYYSDGMRFILDVDYTYIADLTNVTSEEAVVPSHYMGNLVTSIACDSSNLNIKKLIIPQTIVTIQYNCLENLSNMELNLYENGYYLGSEEFPHLWFIAPESKNVVHCNLHPETKVILRNAFENCTYLNSVRLPSNLERIGGDAFMNCGNLDQVIYDGTIENWCNIMLEGILSNPMYYAKHFSAYNGSEHAEITTLDIPETLMFIPDYQFVGFEAIHRLILHPGVTYIGREAFAHCSNLNLVVLPNTISVIGLEAFSNCSSSMEIYYEGGEEEWNFIDSGTVSRDSVYFYSEFEPLESGNYWHYEAGQIVKWKKESL